MERGKVIDGNADNVCDGPVGVMASSSAKREARMG